jgi:Uma2 family endonuclease
MQNVPWGRYEAQLALRGEAPVRRMAYLDGALERMRASETHEQIKGYLGRLIEVYAIERDSELSPSGAWTLTRAPCQVGAKPDECYILGPDQSKDRPDLVIEVVWTRGRLDELEIYRRLDVGEVWFWRDDQIEVYVLRDAGFERSERSVCLPEIDVGTVLLPTDFAAALPSAS